MAQQEKHLGLLEQRIGSTVPSTEQAATLRARVEAPSSEQVIIGGLHEFLTGFIRDNNALGLQIAEDFNFTSARPAPAPTQNHLIWVKIGGELFGGLLYAPRSH